MIAALWVLTAPLTVRAGDDENVDQPPRRTLSLDELLGLPDEADRSAVDAEEAARRDAEEALRRRLEHGRQLVSHFSEALDQMSVSADLLDRQFNSGVGTQRIQEEILARLSHLIDEAHKHTSQSSSSSKRGERQPEPQRDPGARESRQQADQAQRQADGDVEGMPPAMQQTDIDTAIAETREEWGALPERIREMLLQGRQERFSSLYEQLTREYYRRLASD